METASAGWFRDRSYARFITGVARWRGGFSDPKRNAELRDRADGAGAARQASPEGRGLGSSRTARAVSEHRLATGTSAEMAWEMWLTELTGRASRTWSAAMNHGPRSRVRMRHTNPFFTPGCSSQQARRISASPASLTSCRPKLSCSSSQF